MKKILYLIVWILTCTKTTLAADGWLTCLSVDKLRRWEVHMGDIPLVIRCAIDYGIGIAGTIAVIFIIVWAYKILFGSLQQDTNKWKETIVMAITWFVIASLAWFIIKVVLDNI